MSVIAGIVLLWSGSYQTGTVFAQDPPACTSGCDAPASGGAGTGSTGTEAGATTGGAAAGGAGTSASGGSGATTSGGSGSTTGSGSGSTAGSGAASTSGSGTGSTSGTGTGPTSGSATGSTAATSNGSTTGSGTGATGGSGAGSTSGSGAGSTTGGQTSSGAASGTGAASAVPAGGSTTTNSLTNGNGSGSASAGSGGQAGSTSSPAPSSSGSGSPTTGGVTASTGDALAVGNYSETVIQQLVFLFANIEMPGVNASDLNGPLISITQTANVSNTGTATATSGSSNALINFIASLGGVSSVSAHAGASTGDATAVGNMSYTDILQVASVMVTLNGNSSISDQLLSIIQNAGVSNSGSATATSGNSNAAVNIGGGGSDSSASDPSSSGNQDDDQDHKRVYNKQLMWGEAPAKAVVVLLYVDGRQCKQADTEADPERPGSFVWYAYVSLDECGAHPGSTISYAIALPVKQVTKWDNTRRESPEIRLKELMAIKSVYLEK